MKAHTATNEERAAQGRAKANARAAARARTEYRRALAISLAADNASQVAADNHAARCASAWRVSIARQCRDEYLAMVASRNAMRGWKDNPIPSP